MDMEKPLHPKPEGPLSRLPWKTGRWPIEMTIAMITCVTICCLCLIIVPIVVAIRSPTERPTLHRFTLSSSTLLVGDSLTLTFPEGWQSEAGGIIPPLFTFAQKEGRSFSIPSAPLTNLSVGLILPPLPPDIYTVGSSISGDFSRFLTVFRAETSRSKSRASSLLQASLSLLASLDLAALAAEELAGAELSPSQDFGDRLAQLQATLQQVSLSELKAQALSFLLSENLPLWPLVTLNETLEALAQEASSSRRRALLFPDCNPGECLPESISNYHAQATLPPLRHSARLAAAGGALIGVGLTTAPTGLPAQVFWGGGAVLLLRAARAFREASNCGLLTCPISVSEIDLRAPNSTSFRTPAVNITAECFASFPLQVDVTLRTLDTNITSPASLDYLRVITSLGWGKASGFPWGEEAIQPPVEERFSSFPLSAVNITAERSCCEIDSSSRLYCECEEREWEPVVGVITRILGVTRLFQVPYSCDHCVRFCEEDCSHCLHNCSCAGDSPRCEYACSNQGDAPACRSECSNAGAAPLCEASCSNVEGEGFSSSRRR